MSFGLIEAISTHEREVGGGPLGRATPWAVLLFQNLDDGVEIVGLLTPLG